MAENEKLNNVAVDNDVGTMEDVDAIMKKYDRESNTRVWEGTPRKILRVLTALFGIFLIVMNMWIKMDERARLRSSSVWSSFSCLSTTPSRRALRRSTTCLGTISSWRQSARSVSSSTP